MSRRGLTYAVLLGLSLWAGIAAVVLTVIGHIDTAVHTFTLGLVSLLAADRVHLHARCDQLDQAACEWRTACVRAPNEEASWPTNRSAAS